MSQAPVVRSRLALLRGRFALIVGPLVLLTAIGLDHAPVLAWVAGGLLVVTAAAAAWRALTA